MHKPIEISFSKIQAYQRCPWLYHLVFDKDWRSGPHAKQALGNSLHKALADFYSPNNSDRTQDRLVEIFDEVWVNEGYNTPEEAYDAYEWGRQRLETVFRLDATRGAKVLATEKDFDIDLEGLHFRGTVDRIDQNHDGSYSVVEYKTHGEAWPNERIQTDLQMTLYAMGVEKGLGYKPVRLAYYFLSSGKLVETTRAEFQRNQALELLKSIGEKVKNEIFPANEKWCAKCEFKTRCSKSIFKKG